VTRKRAPAPAPAPASRAVASASLRALPLVSIDEPPRPIRETMDATKLDELARSMAQLGLLQPILVVPRGARWEIIAGHRRFMAAQQLAWTEIPAIVYAEKGLAVEAAKLHENLMREDLGAAEEATYYAQLLADHGLDEAGLCALVRHTVDYVGDRLRLLRGCDKVFAALRAKKISFGVARELNKITDAGMRTYYLDSAMRSGCSHRVAADWVQQWKAMRLTTPAPAAPVDGAGAEAPAPAYRIACELCGGDKDPYNLVQVMIHRWEWDEVKRQLARAGARRDE